LTAELAAKRVELARQLMPKGAPLAYLMNPPAPEASRYLQEIETITRALRQELIVLKASNPEQIDVALAEVARRRAGRSSSALTAIFSAAVNRSSPSPRATKFRRSTTGVAMRPLEAL
jgi:hypothetical protein